MTALRVSTISWSPLSILFAHRRAVRPQPCSAERAMGKRPEKI
jgi:hypothetical protein